jgi:hypothetical protein
MIHKDNEKEKKKSSTITYFGRKRQKSNFYQYTHKKICIKVI